jgi:hypothetical protein
MSSSKDDKWFEKHFPSRNARTRADAEIDKLEPSNLMKDFIDVWLREYKRAGGRTDLA